MGYCFQKILNKEKSQIPCIYKIWSAPKWPRQRIWRGHFCSDCANPAMARSRSDTVHGLAHATGVHYQKSSFILLLWNNLNSDQIENWHRLEVSRLLPVGGMCFHWKVLWKEKITSQWWKIRLFWRPRVTFAVWSAHSLISPLQVIENKFAFSLSENNLWVFIISKTVSKNEKISEL